MNQTDFYKKLERDAEQIVLKAGKLLGQYQNNVKLVKLKDAVDLVTTADLASENFIISAIRKIYPHHSICSEEAGCLEQKGEFTWYIDPLDGTKEYARGLNEYNCLLAIEKNKQIVVGVIQRNGTNELYGCSLGNGATLNQKSINVSGNSDLAKSSIGFHLPISSTPQPLIDQSIEIIKKLISKAYRIRPGWDDAKMFGWVGRGVLEAHVLPAGLKNAWHDLAPGLLLVTEAGGKITNWRGKPLQDHDLSGGIVATNGKIHDKLVTLINEK